MSVHVVDKHGRRAYVVRWREGAGDSSRQRSRTFARRGDAAAWDTEIQRRKRLGPIALEQLTHTGPTLGGWITDHWAPEHGEQLEVKTRLRYASSYEVHIEPWLGHLTLQELTVGRLRTWQAERLKDGVSPHSIMKARTFIGSVLRHAAESEAIPGNPLSLVRPPRLPQEDDVVPLPPRLIELLRAVARKPRDQAMISVLAYSGMRPGELRALRWADIGPKNINVQRAADPDGNVKQTKTKHGRRRVRLLAALANDLTVWQEHSGGHGRALVFPRSDGNAMTEGDWNNWRGKQWRPLWVDLDLDEHGLPARPVPYDLRHSFASLLLAEGRTIHYVAEQLGHDPSETLSTYGHVIAEYADRDNVIDIDAEIQQAREKCPAPPPPRPPARQRSARARAKIAAALNGGVTVEELMSATGMPRATLSRHLRAMEHLGEATRRRGATRALADLWAKP